MRPYQREVFVLERYPYERGVHIREVFVLRGVRILEVSGRIREVSVRK
jgi:hypothetical protein